jgi:hypothetical protein
MKKEILYGIKIPYDAPIDELRSMMASDDMKSFSLACEALSYRHSTESYEIMRKYLYHKDKYRRLYVLKTIFRHSEAEELVVDLESAILSDDKLFFENGLIIIAEMGVKVSEEALWSAVERNFDALGYHPMFALKTLPASDKNYNRLVVAFKRGECYQKIIIANILKEKYLPGKARELFELLAADGFAEVRLCAMELAENFKFDNSRIINKMGERIAVINEGRFSFLSKYAGKMLIDYSDNGESVVIYNPNGKESLFASYENDEYTVEFATQHVHLEDRDEAEAWISSVINGELCAIEFFLDNSARFGGEISVEELQNISYEAIENSSAFCYSEPLFSMADRFEIRDWIGKNNIDGRIFAVDGKGEIEFMHV